MNNLHLSKPPPGPRLDYLNPFSNGLVVAHMVNTGAGSISYDISGNGNHGTLTNMVPPTDWVGGSDGFELDLDGVSDYINIAKSKTFSGLSNMTLIIRTNGIAAQSASLVSQYEAAGDQRSWLFRPDVSVAGRLGMLVTDDGTFGAGHFKSYRSSVPFFDGDYHTIGFTFEGITSSLKFFIDGVEDTAVIKITDDSISYLQDSTADLNIATSLSTSYIGRIGYMYIWNRVLSPGEIRGLYYRPYQMISPTTAPILKLYRTPYQRTGLHGGMGNLTGGLM